MEEDDEDYMDEEQWELQAQTRSPLRVTVGTDRAFYDNSRKSN